ncbi:HAD domain-containing protein [Acidovorax sp. NCPPB 3576]|uniref:HAD domain-containing protein n=1 Tax=Acidovorax sp. NCPPB 3576 TaxID=2940488 RepID=UPI00234945CF|nr:HAD domain-containing protein [Acidovorax sp. NCPPB 3576]WCM90484.1 HAD domain-containing protein [Acidovorax sp. NCPPB 3576]
MPILFLDFDGVLHPEHCHESKHFCCLPILEDALRQVPEYEVVITSTWRLQKSLDDLCAYFSNDVMPRIAGVSPQFGELTDVPDTLRAYQRQAECRAWLSGNGLLHHPWLAIDDRPWLYRPFTKSLFLVDGSTGLTEVSGAQLVKRLRQLI